MQQMILGSFCVSGPLNSLTWLYEINCGSGNTIQVTTSEQGGVVSDP